MKGTCCWSDLGQKLIAHAPRAGQHLASGRRVLRTRLYFPRIYAAPVRLFRALRPFGDLIVIAPLGLSLTCETCSATFAPGQKRPSPLRAHPPPPNQLVIYPLTCRTQRT